MNDISLKIVESPKSHGGVDVSPTGDTSAENEVDPLAIDEGELERVKEPVSQEAVLEKVDEEKAGNCDDNAKEENISESQTGSSDSFVNVQPEKPENANENLKQDRSSSSPPVAPKTPTPEPPKPQNEPAPTIEPVPSTSKAPDVIEKVVALDKPVVETVVPVKEPVSVKEELMVVEEPKKLEPEADADMTEVVTVEEKAEQKVEKPKPKSVNGDVVAKEEQGTKRRPSEDVDTESPLKKLCQEVEKTFPQHDTMINDYIQRATKNNVDELQRHTEQLLSEIQTLRELAQKKEHEWNNILHLKKVKEEILLRLLRRKQVLNYEKSQEVNGGDRDRDPFDFLNNQAKNLAIDKSDEISGLSLKQPGASMAPMLPTPIMPSTSHFNPMAVLPPPYDKAHMSMPKPVFPQQMMMPGHLTGFPRDMNGQLPSSFGLPMGRQGPTKDVKSIIADYRQRNPEVTPRRGRRMKSILNPNMMNAPRPIAPKVDNLNNLNNINMLFNNLDMNQKAMLERLQQFQASGLPNGLSFKDVLVQFANMQQASAGLIPNRPPETITTRPEHHIRPEGRRGRQERSHEDVHVSVKQQERLASPSPRLPPPPPYPEISLLPVTTSQSETTQQNSLLHGILTKQSSPASHSYSPTLAKLLMSPERIQSAPTLPSFGQAKNCGEITITPVQPAPTAEPQPEKPEEVVQLDDEESPASEGEASGSPSGSGSGRLVIDEGGGEAPTEGAAEQADTNEDTPLCQGCRRRDAQFVCAGCANQWYCSRDCQVAAWDEHSDMCSG
ncbi:hypothetical protein SFRURICE_003304 [Spodoptera frugiperda]|uniref:SFRICE_005368 n=1 Tax=Spodoptera frugiperda TaxID=7108 RepID=A0A2H1WR99_SPOFR|nr:hypothetical protein SFRURICE_003304 [Spodoptera frugiperda]